jgi:hypothetical protein
MVLDEPWKVGTSAVKKVDITEHSNRYCCESVLRLHADDYLCLGNQVRNAFSLSGIQPQHYSQLIILKDENIILLLFLCAVCKSCL